MNINIWSLIGKSVEKTWILYSRAKWMKGEKRFRKKITRAEQSDREKHSMIIHLRIKATPDRSLQNWSIFWSPLSRKAGLPPPSGGGRPTPADGCGRGGFVISLNISALISSRIVGTRKEIWDVIVNISFGKIRYLLMVFDNELKLSWFCLISKNQKD